MLYNIGMNKVQIYYAKIKPFGSEEFASIVEELPNIKKTQLMSFRLEKDRNASLSAYLLLKEALKANDIKINDYEYVVSEKGKPSLFYCPYQFSISHTGGLCVVAISIDEVGIDVEKVKPYTLKIERIFTLSDCEFINTSEQKEKAFYQIWTSKEAYVKALGTGLSTAFNSFEVVNLNEKHLVHFEIDDYMISAYTKTCSEFEKPVEVIL